MTAKKKPAAQPGECAHPPLEAPPLGTPMPGEVWRHIKGGVYRVMNLARWEATGELCVVYQQEHGGVHLAEQYMASQWIRTAQNFLARFDRVHEAQPGMRTEGVLYVPLLVATADGREVFRITDDGQLQPGPAWQPTDAAAKLLEAYAGLRPPAPVSVDFAIPEQGGVRESPELRLTEGAQCMHHGCPFPANHTGPCYPDIKAGRGEAPW